MNSYDIVENIKSPIHASNTPNVRGVIRRLSSKMPTLQKSQNLFDYARKCVQPGIDYFQKQLTANLKNSIAVFKAARLFSPHKLQVMQPEADVVNTL